MPTMVAVYVFIASNWLGSWSTRFVRFFLASLKNSYTFPPDFVLTEGCLKCTIHLPIADLHVPPKGQPLLNYLCRRRRLPVSITSYWCTRLLLLRRNIGVEVYKLFQRNILRRENSWHIWAENYFAFKWHLIGCDRRDVVDDHIVSITGTDLTCSNLPKNIFFEEKRPIPWI